MDQPPTVIATLARDYGLTPAEARLAIALSNGQSLRDIADQHALSKETVRTQLRTVFDKTGVHRQSELVRLVLSLPTAPFIAFDSRPAGANKPANGGRPA